MLLRRDEHGVLAIGQASHAWLSGQLARNWGNQQFGSVEPWEEVCLATEQHDVGMAAWDREPSYDERTGLPHSFTEMPLEVHTELWLQGPRRMVSQSAYAALLVSMHGWRLYKRRDLDKSPPEVAERIRAFLAAQRAFQDQMLRALATNPAAADAIAPDMVERNSLLLWTWDYLSLALCLGWAPASAQGAPLRTGRADIELRPTGRGSLTLDPWPFQTETVRVRCEGRRLPERLANESEMRRTLSNASLETLKFVLERSA
jgi:hypothetical protein